MIQCVTISWHSFKKGTKEREWGEGEGEGGGRGGGRGVERGKVLKNIS